MEEKLVIFDLDGTLYKTHKTLLSAIYRAFEDLGMSAPTEKQIISLIGETMVDFYDKLAPNISEEEKKILANKIRMHERKLVHEKGELYEGVKKLLDDMVDLGFKLAICSNGSREYVNTVLDTFNIKDSFVTVRGRDHKYNKASLIKSILVEHNTQNAIIVGDTIYDIEVAHNNNIPCIGVTHGYGKNLFKSADFIANNAQEIKYNILRADIFYKIYKQIKENKNPSCCYIVGINGVDTSGKSIMSEAFNRFLQAKGHKTQLIHIDDFHNESNIRYQGENEIDSYIDNAFDLIRLKEELLLPVKTGSVINKELLLLDLDTDKFTNKKKYYLDNDTIVIIEGVLLYREPIVEFIDTKVFIDISFDTVIKRAKQRDVPKYGEKFLQKYKDKYIPIQKIYLNKFSPKKNSHFVIDNNDYLNPVIKNNT